MSECGIPAPPGEEEQQWLAVRKMSGSEYDDLNCTSEASEAIRTDLLKAEKKLNIEKRTVFRGWLKDLFLAQAILSFVLSFFMAFTPSTIFGGFSWYNDPRLGMDLAIRVLGFWWWWLFIIPSLRSRRPQGAEKQALDYAFLATPIASLLAPAATTDTGIIWTIDALVTAGCYTAAYAGVGGEVDKSGAAGWIFRALDMGSGKERGEREGAREARLEKEMEERGE